MGKDRTRGDELASSLPRLWRRDSDVAGVSPGYSADSPKEVCAVTGDSGIGDDGIGRNWHSYREWLWTFLEVPGVKPTDNATERSLRHTLVRRHLSLGTQSKQ